MRKIKKLLAIVLAVVMVMPIAMFSASAATPAAPEFKLAVVSETSSTVVVRFSLVKGAFSALDFTVNTSSAIKECTKIEKHSDFVAVITDCVNNGIQFASAENAASRKVAISSVENFDEPFAIYDFTFAKKTSAGVTATDFSVKIDNCVIISDSVVNGSTNVDVTGKVKVTFEFFSFVLNDTSVAMSYKDTYTINYTTNYAPESLTWTSSNEKVVKVDENGNLTTTGTGSATITVTSADGKVNQNCEVSVSYQWWQWIIVIVLFGWIWY